MNTEIEPAGTCTLSQSSRSRPERSRPRKARAASLLLLAPFLAVLAYSGPVAWLATRSLEVWSPPSSLAGVQAEAIVALSGPNMEARLEHAASLYKYWRPLPVLASVGRGSADRAVPSIPAHVVLAHYGVPPSNIWIEARSENTYEDTLYSADTLRRKGIRRIVLVTEAIHMLRAVKCFRRQGLEVTPAPSGYRAVRFASARKDWLLSRANLTDTREALHEWIGLVWYLARGYI